MLKLLGGKTKGGAHFLQTLELSVVLSSIDPVGAAACLEKLINDIFVYSRQRKENVARCPGQINRSGTIKSKVFVPVFCRSKLLPALHLLQLVDTGKHCVGR